MIPRWATEIEVFGGHALLCTQVFCLVYNFFDFLKCAVTIKKTIRIPRIMFSVYGSISDTRDTKHCCNNLNIISYFLFSKRAGAMGLTGRGGGDSDRLYRISS